MVWLQGTHGRKLSEVSDYSPSFAETFVQETQIKFSKLHDSMTKSESRLRLHHRLLLTFDKIFQKSEQ